MTPPQTPPRKPSNAPHGTPLIEQSYSTQSPIVAPATIRTVFAVFTVSCLLAKATSSRASNRDALPLSPSGLFSNALTDPLVIKFG